MPGIVIVGGGAAGYRAARRILELDPLCDVTIISDDDRPAYERPMLSKELLVDDQPLRSIGIKGEFANLRQLFRTRATKIDRENRIVTTSDGEPFRYDMLLLATGSRPRRLETGTVPQDAVHYLRTAQDAERLRPRLGPDKTIAIIGGGFIGLEVAASARAHGANVIVVEAQDRLLARVAPASLSDWLFRLHREKGVAFRLGAKLKSIETGSSGKLAVLLDDQEIAADLAVIGIGVLPNVELARECGLEVDGGIVVDAFGRTSDPNIVAAGEVTTYPLAHLGLSIRSECWTAASDQGTVAGETALGHLGEGYREMPWLWSDQYGASIQYIGVPLIGSTIVTVAGENADSWIDVAWDTAGRFMGAIGVNANRQISELRRVLKKGMPIPDKYAIPVQAAE